MASANIGKYAVDAEPEPTPLQALISDLIQHVLTFLKPCVKNRNSQTNLQRQLSFLVPINKDRIVKVGTNEEFNP